MARPPPYPKKIEKTEKLFYHFKISPSIYSLYDSDMSTPIAYGSFNFVAGVISNLPTTSTLFYFEIDTRLGWKMKKTYKPNAQPEKIDKAKERIEDKKEQVAEEG